MIYTKQDLLFYIEQDLLQRKVKNGWTGDKSDPLVRYQVALRYLEYHSNNTGVFHKILRRFFRWRKKKLDYKLGLTVPINCFGPGLVIAHYGLCVVNRQARIGKNCMIHAGVNIGEKNGYPKIGDNVFIGPGAKIFGPIEIGNNVQIGANAVVNKSFPDNVSIAGVPAKVVKILK